MTVRLKRLPDGAYAHGDRTFRKNPVGHWAEDGFDGLRSWVTLTDLRNHLDPDYRPPARPAVTPRPDLTGDPAKPHRMVEGAFGLRVGLDRCLWGGARCGRGRADPIHLWPDHEYADDETGRCELCDREPTADVHTSTGEVAA